MQAILQHVGRGSIAAEHLRYFIGRVFTHFSDVGVVEVVPAAVLEGAIYALGGMDPNGLCARAEFFVPRLGTWQTASPLSSPRGGLAATAFGSAILAFGGRRGAVVSTVERFVPRSGVWSATAPLPTARSSLAAACLGDSVLVLGGITDAASGAAMSTVERFEQRYRLA